MTPNNLKNASIRPFAKPDLPEYRTGAVEDTLGD
jgi:hypothetical protein